MGKVEKKLRFVKTSRSAVQSDSSPWNLICGSVWASPKDGGVKRKVRGGINPAERGAPLRGPGSWCYLNQSWYAGLPNRVASINGALKRSRQHRAAGTELHCRYYAQFIFYSLLLPLWEKSTPPLRYALCHWHVFQMCFSLARRGWITGGQGKQTVVLLYRLHKRFVECEWTQAKCHFARVLIHIWVCGYTKRQLFSEKSKHKGYYNLWNSF